MKTLIIFIIGICFGMNCTASSTLKLVEEVDTEDVLFPVKGFSINSPNVSEVDAFCDFVEKELAPMGVNLLLLRINYQFNFQSVGKMSASLGFPLSSVRKLEKVCKRNRIRLVPHLELFGHQSGGAPEFAPNGLLKNYPEFDESFGKPNDVNYGYRSYCPLHPEIHSLLFKMIEEMANAFQSKDFHIGCDEVMTLGVCDRCKGFLTNGGTRAELFANEINLLSDFLSSKGYRTWIWGDRLINVNDASKHKVDVLTEWEASKNDTYPAIDRINKQILICDWHYKGAPTTHLHFAQKGFDVIPCFYNVETAAMKMLDNIVETRTKEADKMIRERCRGIMGTHWGSSVTAFINEFRKVKDGTHTTEKTGAYVFYQVFNKMKELETNYANNKNESL